MPVQGLWDGNPVFDLYVGLQNNHATINKQFANRTRDIIPEPTSELHLADQTSLLVVILLL